MFRKFIAQHDKVWQLKTISSILFICWELLSFDCRMDLIQRYHVDEFRYRYSNFKVNLDAIATHNRDETKSYKLSVNHLADLSQEDVSFLHVGPSIMKFKDDTYSDCSNSFE